MDARSIDLKEEAIKYWLLRGKSGVLRVIRLNKLSILAPRAGQSPFLPTVEGLEWMLEVASEVCGFG